MKKKVETRKKKVKEPKDPTAPKEINAFDFVNSINFSKEDLIRSSDQPDHLKKVYCPFVTNHSMSFHIESIFDANMMNQSAHLDPQMQFDFLRASVRRGKRWSKWFKPILEDDIKLIQEVYGCNHRRAVEYRAILDDQQMVALKSKREIGGK